MIHGMSSGVVDTTYSFGYYGTMGLLRGLYINEERSVPGSHITCRTLRGHSIAGGRCYGDQGGYMGLGINYPSTLTTQ